MIYIIDDGEEYSSGETFFVETDKSPEFMRSLVPVVLGLNYHIICVANELFDLNWQGKFLTVDKFTHNACRNNIRTIDLLTDEKLYDEIYDLIYKNVGSYFFEGYTRKVFNK
jgi:hypothetical protein